MSTAQVRVRRWKVLAAVSAASALSALTVAPAFVAAEPVAFPAAAQQAPAPRAAAPDDPNNGALVVIVDGSGSMRRRDVAPNRMVAAKEAAKAVVQSLPLSLRVGLLAYGTKIGNSDAEREAGCKDITTLSAVRTMSEEYRASLIDKIEAITPSGWTPIGLALQRGVLSLPDRRGQVVIVTDGEDSCAPPDPCQMARALKQRYPDVTVSTVGLTIGLSDQLACIAEATGGIFVTADDTTQLQRRLAAITNEPSTTTFLTPTGYGVAQLGDSYEEIAGKLEGFPSSDQGEPVGGVWNLRDLTRFSHNGVDYYFNADERLVAVQPGQPVTIDGIAVGSSAAQVVDVYGKPVQLQAPYALYAASAQTEAGYLTSYDGNPRNGESKVTGMLLCLCVPRPAKPTTTTTTTTLPPDEPTTSTTLPKPIVVLTATGYGDAFLGESYDELAAKLPEFPALDSATEHPGLWNLDNLRQIHYEDATYLFDQDNKLVAIQPDQPLTVDGIDDTSTVANVNDIYGKPLEVRGQQALYEAAVDSNAAYVINFNGGASRGTSKVNGIAVCLCRPPVPTTTTQPQPAETDPPATTTPPPPPPPPPTTPQTQPTVPVVVTTEPAPETLPPEPETTVAKTTKPPKTTVPETTVPETIPPEPETTVPETVPADTTPESTAPPTTLPRPTIVDPANVPVLLKPTGIGDVAFGTPANDAVAALTALLGAPSDDPGNAPDPDKDCGGPRIVRWAFSDVDVEVWITAAEGQPDGVFSSYSVSAPNDPTFPVHTVSFENGATLGMTWGEWQQLLPGSTLEADADTGIPYGATENTYFASFVPPESGDAPPTDETRIRAVNVGQKACLGA